MDRLKKAEDAPTGDIAHTFNNILTAIMGNIELARLAVDNDNKEKAFKRLNEAEKASVRAKDLIQKMLKCSKDGEPVKLKK